MPIFKLTEDGASLKKFEGSSVVLKIYDEWYNGIKGIQEKLRDDRLRGFLSRMHTIMLKVAMALRVAHSDDLTLTTLEIKRSIFMLEQILDTASDALGGQGTGKGAPDADRILKQIYQYKNIPYDELLQLNFRHTSKEEFDAVLAILEGMSVITRSYDGASTVLHHKGYKRGAGKLKEDTTND